MINRNGLLATHPKRDRMGKWLRNRRYTTKNKSQDSSQPEADMAIAKQKQSMDQWMQQEPKDASDVITLLVARVRPPLLSQNAMCIPFLCEGMAQTMARFRHSRWNCLLLDVK